MELRLKLTVLACLLLLAFPCFAKEPIRTIEGLVTNVSDGDTIQVTDQLGTKVKVRLYGIDAPETAKGSKPGQPHGMESHQALMVKVMGQDVRLEVLDIDKYRRLVALVWQSGRNINIEMVSEGHAWAYRSYLGRAHASDYITAEGQARKAKKGLWQQDNPQPPWEVRKSMSAARQ
ncbi:MAG: thermonuclease family protein [Trichlorobacter sp.]